VSFVIPKDVVGKTGRMICKGVGGRARTGGEGAEGNKKNLRGAKYLKGGGGEELHYLGRPAD